MIPFKRTYIFGREYWTNVTLSQGDSGGLLVYYKSQKPIQIGLLEFGCSSCGYNHTAYANFISVSYFRDWIDGILSMPWNKNIKEWIFS
jgi:secreted trypsin-like serine protease